MKNILDKLTPRWILLFYIINGIICSTLMIITSDYKTYLILFLVISIFTVLSVIDGIYSVFLNQNIISESLTSSINTNFEYEITQEEAIDIFNKLQVCKEYEVLDLITGEWNKQTYQPQNEQETYEKMIHGIRYGWIRIYKTDLYGGYFN